MPLKAGRPETKMQWCVRPAEYMLHCHPIHCRRQTDQTAKNNRKPTLSCSAGIAGCTKPEPAIVRGTLKVFFLLLVSFLVTTGGVAAVSLAPLLLPAPSPESSSALSVAYGKHSRSTSDQRNVGSLADGLTARNVTCSTMSTNRNKTG